MADPLKTTEKAQDDLLHSENQIDSYNKVLENETLPGLMFPENLVHWAKRTGFAILYKSTFHMQEMTVSQIQKLLRLH
jgi:hypothetical protein